MRELSSMTNKTVSRRSFLKVAGSVSFVIGNSGVIAACSNNNVGDVSGAGGSGSFRNTKHMGHTSRRRHSRRQVRWHRDGSGLNDTRASDSCRTS